MQPPNIIYLHSHDTGRYVSPYGHPARTPNLQRFAEQGVLFRKAFTVNPTCSPSRASLLTGIYPHNNGMLGLAHRGFALSDPKQHIVHSLKSAGYHTVLAGLQHIAERGEAERNIGYDEYINERGNHVYQAAPAAVGFLKNAPQKPFFLDVGFIETHRAFPDHAPADDPRYTPPPAPLPDTPETRRDMADYYTMAHQLDDGVGQVLAGLEEAGLADNTLVIITTDHGIAFPHMKCNLTDHGTGVMLMMRGPSTGAASVFRGGSAIDAMVTHLDLFPTICESAGIEKPQRLQGKSLLPLVRGECETLHEQVFTTVNFHAAYEPKRAVRTERYKYIRNFQDDRDRPVLPNCDDGLSKRLWVNHGWAETGVAREYLFDLMFDPHETRNLADRPEMGEVLDDMRSRLRTWMEQTEDPLLKGPLTIPAGATLNPQDGRDPIKEEAEYIRTPRSAP